MDTSDNPPMSSVRRPILLSVLLSIDGFLLAMTAVVSAGSLGGGARAPTLLVLSVVVIFLNALCFSGSPRALLLRVIAAVMLAAIAFDRSLSDPAGLVLLFLLVQGVLIPVCLRARRTLLSGL